MKTSLVVTHYVFIFVSHYDVSRVLLPMFAVGWCNEVWLMPFLHCRCETLLSFLANPSMGNVTKPKWLDRLLVFCKY